MPPGIQILNARRLEPNPRITFIKPLKGPDEPVAREFLERIAAQCVPIMREQHLRVTSLEEYEPNREFVGRNFNGGEVIQLVLRARGPGRPWLPFAYVQMVMMHELAHCRHMNHSRAFWAVRDAFAADMRRLWAAHYTGEGLWGRGARLGVAGAGPPAYERNMASATNGADGMLLEHLCGGTYRSRQGAAAHRNKRPAPASYRERQERRIRRKFGASGVALGDDLATRATQETKTETAAPVAAPTKKGLAVRPRVAKSKRGRELRAAAALVRFEQNQAERETAAPDAEDDGADGADDDDDDDDDALAAIKQEEDADRYWSGSDDNDLDLDLDLDDDVLLSGPDAVDLDGARLLDRHGQGMVRVCEGETGGNTSADGDADDSAQRELRDLLETAGGKTGKKDDDGARAERPLTNTTNTTNTTNKTNETKTTKTAQTDPAPRPQIRIHKRVETEETDSRVKQEATEADDDVVLLSTNPVAPSAASTCCPLCSFDNDLGAAACAVCSHVLAAGAPGAWHCRSAACRASGSRYRNAGDRGVCGACGARREGR